eukprot:TRINITY_DN412_c0_g1_i2.p1 TRINITY_DN412_c0_g1~~TRINITY_DN412_c0_g1_i2.p1  ORF type:complete len:304 (+),score=38.12 TRINITY_DN412_c0_g1_i2:47-958(+)
MQNVNWRLLLLVFVAWAVLIFATRGAGSGTSEKPYRVMPKSYDEEQNLEGLMKALKAKLEYNQPENPVSYLQELLQNASSPKVIIMGAPASGKGTQCEMLVKALGIVHISTGDLLRAEVKKGSKLGKEAQDFMNNGQLVPDKLVISLLENRIQQDDVQASGWLLDGFPRTPEQAEVMKSKGLLPHSVVVLDVPNEVVIERIEGRRIDEKTGISYHLKYRPPPKNIPKNRLVQRADDTRPKIMARLESYEKNLEGLVAAFTMTCPIYRVNGEKLTPSQVFSVVTKYVQTGRWRSLGEVGELAIK